MTAILARDSLEIRLKLGRALRTRAMIVASIQSSPYRRACFLVQDTVKQTLFSTNQVLVQDLLDRPERKTEEEDV